MRRGTPEPPLSTTKTTLISEHKAFSDRPQVVQY